MRMRIGLALLFIVAGAEWAAAQANSALDRLTRREETLGWEAVGRLDVGDTGYCTGTLIATDLVLTAAHCLFDKATGSPVAAGTIVFRAGLSDGVAVAEVPVLRAVAHPGYNPATGPELGSVRHDVALLQLARPIPSAVAAPFVVQTPGNLRQVSVVSYAQGRDDALSWQRTCGVVGRQDGLLAFDCDVDHGSSGAPVFDRSQRRARIVSIISSGGQMEDGRAVSLGMELPGLLADLKAALRSGRGVLSAEVAAPPAVRRIGSGGASRDIGARFVKP